MPHLPPLVVTLAVALGLAFLLGYGAARLRLPPLIGYLAAGWLVGPFGPFAGTGADAAIAAELAELGVILLMFGVGIHFSVDDLLAVRREALPGALTGMLVTGGAGAALGLAWGWSGTQAGMFGLAVCISSTVVVIRTFEQRGALGDADGRLAVGWMIVEDLVMVLALVLLPVLAGTLGATSVDGAAPRAPLAPEALAGAIAVTVGKVVAFVAIMWVVGRRVIPALLWNVARTGSRELFTLAVLAAALGIAVGATALFGVSVALGAFCAGLVISESDLSHQAAADALPLQDAFAVVFFVSVGMLFDPSVVTAMPGRLLALVALVLAVKPVVASLLLIRLKRPPRVATAVGASLGEIGEFSFILAGLGVSLGLLADDGRQLVLAAAIVTISLNPLLGVPARRAARWLVARDAVRARLEGGLGRLVTGGDGAPAPEPAVAALDGHAIIVGYGRVGSTIGEALHRCGAPFVVVEQDVRLVDLLRAAHIPVVVGDAARPPVFALTAPARARLLVVTAPDPFEARQVIELARAANPDIETVVRTHSAAEQAYLERLAVGRAVMGERELALGMAHFALVACGRDDALADDIVEALRAAGRAAREGAGGGAALGAAASGGPAGPAAV